MTEVDVALSDYLLALECFLFYGLIGRNSTSRRSKSYKTIFLSLGLASFLGLKEIAGRSEFFTAVSSHARHDIRLPEGEYFGIASF